MSYTNNEKHQQHHQHCLLIGMLVRVVSSLFFSEVDVIFQTYKKASKPSILLFHNGIDDFEPYCTFGCYRVISIVLQQI